jgi:hypothetical protein
MAVKFIARFKTYKFGDVASFDAEQESWLISRLYAVNHAGQVPAERPAPLQDEPPKKPLTTRRKGAK